ncbi:hypothetical protein DL762_001308 [Monosporascus cannonballus]|uniref:Heterokaryon incompatibility domain-containing protein n=1 Tax=Monosporascus cannonballus TaxID=155416 RepID=A0ABY0HGQ2_9PEZI|nr:hypothetical protein DL762_001308 [Monosporascus cannonballus]
MRLLKCSDGQFKLTNDLVHDIPSYAILSHTWGPDTEEVTFRDLVDDTGKDKIGYEKIKFCAEQAKRDGLQYFWVDTCCIDKSNNTELSRAINSMFRWYQNAARCYVYMSGISATGYESSQQSGLAWESAFRAHRWFTRGWTLQELLAPTSVEFFTQDGRRLGDKKSLEQQIHEITGIAVPALRGSDLSQFDVEERFKWAEARQTTHEEDWAYCLLGIFAKNCTWMVPFEQNPSFTGRLGGVGKTQLALELVYRIRAEHKNYSVIWIPATSKETLGQAYLNAARQLGISGCEDDKADVKRLVRDHLSSESAGQWLLVFDNADDVGMWVSKSTPESDRLIDCLPRSSYGSIIFTTRDKKTAVRLAGRNVVEMSEMGEAGSKQLLEKYLVDQGLLRSKGDAAALLARLTYLPLAIVQAAVYINANGIGLGDYLSLLEEQEEDVINLLSEDFEDEGRYGDVKNPVATTWLISFEQIRQRDPLAADYLSFMACVDAKDIPQSLLPPGQSRKKEVDAMGTLQGYSFLAKRSADSAVNIHRLVHLATRNWLRKEGLLPGWIGRVIARLAEVLGDVGRDNRVAWRSYMPHAYYALGSRLIGEDDEDGLILLWKYGLCLYYDGRYREAKAPFERVVEIRKTRLGADHPLTLRSMAKLASTYRKQGRWEKAEKLQIQVMEIRKTKLGADHLHTLTSIASLASTYREQGRWKEAEKLQIQVLEIRKTKLGADHPHTLTNMANLASTYREQGRWEEAKKLQVQVIEIRKTKFGADHPDTLTSMATLASTYQEQGRWEEAEELQAKELEISSDKAAYAPPSARSHPTCKDIQLAVRPETEGGGSSARKFWKWVEKEVEKEVDGERVNVDCSVLQGVL